MTDRAGVEHAVVGQHQRHRRIELAEAAQHPILPHRLVVAGNPHGAEQFLGDVDLAFAVHALIFAVADDVPFRFGAGDHLFHVAAAHALQRLAGQDMDIPRLGVHGGWRALGGLDDLFDHRPRHGLVREATHAAAGLHQRLVIHSPFLRFPQAALAGASDPPL